MTISQRVIVFVVATFLMGATNAISFDQSDVDEHVKLLRNAIDGRTFEMKSAGTTEEYKYDRVNFEQCSLRWTEDHKSREGTRLTLREFSETTVSLDVLDIRAVRSEKLKVSGFQVSLVTKGLKPGFFTRQRLQWGDEPVTESQGISTGAAFYFGDRETADNVSKAIIALARSCTRK